MIFRHTVDAVLNGTKTQTRRLVKPPPDGEVLVGWETSRPPYVWNGRIKWMVGRTYAVQPGRGKEAVGRIRLTAIRQERLREITAEDAMAEGVHIVPEGYWESEFRLGWFTSPLAAFAALWDSIHKKTGTQWADNPLVWVLGFEAIEARGDQR